MMGSLRERRCRTVRGSHFLGRLGTAITHQRAATRSVPFSEAYLFTLPL